MGIALVSFFFILGKFARKSKVITILILILMWILLAFNTMSPDGETYRTSYNNFAQLGNHYEPLYTIFILYAHKVNFSFDIFRAVYSFLIVYFTYLGCKKFTEFTTIALSNYLVTFFIWYISGMRIALAIAITMYAVSFLLSENKRALFSFCFFLFLAVMIHYSCALFYLLLLARQKEIKWKRFALIFIFVCVVTIVVLKTNVLFSLVTKFTNREKTTSWFVNDQSAAGRSTLVGLVTSLTLIFGNVFVSYYAKCYTIRNIEATSKDRYRAIFIYNANCTMLLLIPLIFLNINFMRIYVGMSVITLFGITTVMNQSRKQISQKFTYTLLDGMAFAWLLYYFLLYNIDKRVLDMISNNKLFLF